MNPVSFVEALKIAAQQQVVLPDEYYGERIGLTRAVARTVSDLAGIDQIQHVFDQLDAVMKAGGTFADFKKSVQVDLPEYRKELVFRNNIQTAYVAGRWQQVQRNKKSRPYLRYIAINDGRTRPSHARMHNHIAPVDDPWWRTHHPLNGHGCRCSTQSLTEAEARRRGIPTQPPANAEPDAQWDYNPGMARWQGVEQAAQAKQKAVHPALKGAVDHAVSNNEKPGTPAQAIEMGKIILQKAGIQGKLKKEDYEEAYTALFRALKSQRKFGSVKPAIHGKGKGAKSLQIAAARLPDDWVEKANNEGVTYARWADKRGFHIFIDQSFDGKYIKLPVFGVKKVRAGDSYIATRSTSTSLHEYVHRIQKIMPGLDAIFQAEHQARTATDKLEQLSKLTGKKYKETELTKKDHYVDPYFGREYDGGNAAEVMTMALEYVLGGHDYKFTRLYNDDPDLFMLAVGLLAAY